MGIENISTSNNLSCQYYAKDETDKQPQGSGGKIRIFPQHSSYTMGANFQKFTFDVDAAQTKILEDIQNGTISTEEQRKQRHSEMRNMSFDVTGDEYRTLASKSNRTPEETQRAFQLYKEGFLKFGTSYTAYLDKKYGNGDGILTEEEYINSEIQDLPNDLKEFASRSDAKNIFSHIDLNKDGQISPEEMAAMASMLDMSVGLEGDKAGGINGKIKACDMTANMMNMVKSSDTTGGKAIDNKMQTMYNFLFKSN